MAFGSLIPGGADEFYDPREAEAESTATLLGKDAEAKKRAGMSWGDTFREYAAGPSKVWGSLISAPQPGSTAATLQSTTAPVLDRLPRGIGRGINALFGPSSQPSQADTELRNLGANLTGGLADATRSGFTAPGEAVSGKLPMVDPETGHTSEEAVRRAFDTASLAGGASAGASVGREAARAPGLDMRVLGRQVLASDTGKPGGVVSAVEHAAPNLRGVGSMEAGAVRPAINENLPLVERLPQPLSHEDRAWQNYGRHMSPDDVLGSEAVWGNAHRWAQEGMGAAEGFAHMANEMWQRMGANQHITPEIAKRYMARERSGLQVVPEQLSSDTGKPGAAISAVEHAAPFYSSLDQLVAAQPGRMTGSQWAGFLANKGAKLEEMDWRGVNDFLRERADKPVTKADLEAHLGANKVEFKPVELNQMPEDWNNLSSEQRHAVADKFDSIVGRRPHGDELPDWYNHVAAHSRGRGETGLDSIFNPPRWPDYQLPGGENYRERLLTLPERGKIQYSRENVKPIDPVTDTTGVASDPQRFWYFRTPDNVLQIPKSNYPNQSRAMEYVIREKSPPAPADKNYRSAHWKDEPNVLVHRRSTDRSFEQPLTPEQEAQFNKRADMNEQIDHVIDQQRVVAGQIKETVKPLYEQRDIAANREVNAGRMSMREYRDHVEAPIEHPDLTRLQNRLQALRAEEDQLRKSLPAEVHPNATRSLHLEEIQSDWHQAGRQKGYSSDYEVFDPVTSKVQARYKTRAEAEKAVEGTRLDFDQAKGHGVPDAPFRKSWHELALKDAIREAAEKGMDRISWTAGKAQPTNPKNLMQGGGPPNAERLAANEKADAGLRGFYDKILVDSMNKIGKAHGVKVQMDRVAGRDQGAISGSKAMDRMHGKPGWEDIPTREDGRGEWFSKLNPKRRDELFEAARNLDHPVHYMDIPQSLKDQALKKGFSLFEDTGPTAAAVAIGAHTKPDWNAALKGADYATGRAEAGLDDTRGVGGPAGRSARLEQAQREAARHAGSYEPLEGLPRGPFSVKGEDYVPGPMASVHETAKRYMESTGRPYQRQDRYHPIDEAHARRIAQAFEEMPHAPDDPKVKASYDAMIRETRDQYRALVDSGVKLEPIKPGMEDPYIDTPRGAAKDIQENNHLWFFPTEQGFGTNPSGIDMAKHPMMQQSGEALNGRPLLNNDLFRVVHDYFGHFKEGHGFRGAGEDNAWRTHSMMYSPEARPAMTTETRGQNSWLNYGPHGEKNRKASAADTVYAEQKVGVMPDWTHMYSDSGRTGAAIAAAEHVKPDWDAALRGEHYGHAIESARSAIEAPAIAKTKLVDEHGFPIEGKAYTKEARAVLEDIAKGPKGAGPMDLSTQGRVPDVPQMPLQRYEPPRGVSERLQAALANPDVIKGVRDSIKKGMNVANWYHTDPVRRAFIGELGPVKGAEEFGRYMDAVAATSPRSDVPTNIRNASYYYSRGTPENLPAKNPYPYGHVAQKLHRGNFETISGKGWDPLQNPKPASFAENLRGNLNPVTVDTHAFRNIGMRSGNPDFLETSFTQKYKPGVDRSTDGLVRRYGEVKGDKVTFRPQQLFKEGKLTLEEARDIPSFWATKPRESEYGAAEDFYRALAKKAKIAPADAQAAAWSGAGDLTGLGTVGTHTFPELMNERILFTARMRGETPEKVLRDFIRGKKALLSNTAKAGRPVATFGRLNPAGGAGFDPEGEGYDYKSAIGAGLGPDATGHWPSRAPNSGQILKGRGHHTFSLTEKGEADAGYKIERGPNGRYYSKKDR